MNQQLSLFRMGFLLEKLLGLCFSIPHMKSVIHMLSFFSESKVTFYVLEMNFPLPANTEANTVPGTGYQETDFFVLVAIWKEL